MNTNVVISKRIYAIMALAMALGGCKSDREKIDDAAYDRLEPKFAAACYGERKDWKRRYLLSDERLRIEVKVQRKDWPQVRDFIRDV